MATTQISIGAFPTDNEKGTLAARAIDDVVLALHLDQPREGALELEGAVAGERRFPPKELRPMRSTGSRLIERVDQDVEAPGLVVLLSGEARVKPILRSA
jgi:hypothetical protein